MQAGIRPSVATELQDAARQIQGLEIGPKLVFTGEVARYVYRRCHYLNHLSGETRYRTQRVADEMFVWRVS